MAANLGAKGEDVKPWIVAVGLVATVGLTLLTMVSPVAGLAVLLGGFFLLWVALKPESAAYTLVFLTVAFPKAGIKVGTFPFPVFIFGLALALLLLMPKAGLSKAKLGAFFAVGVYLLWACIRAIQFVGQSDVGTVAAFVAWSVVPIALLTLTTSFAEKIPRLRTTMENGFLLAATYGLAQQVIGIDRTTIPGLTIAYGDSYADKNNVIFDPTGDYSKIPSTYQNGNIFGVTAAVFLTLALMRVSNRSSTRKDVAMLVAAGLSIALSGSRTGIVIAIVGAVIVFLRNGHLGRKIGALSVIALAAIVVVTVQPQLLTRYSLDNVLSSGGAGRTEIWQGAMAALSPGELLFGSRLYVSHEGWAGIVEQIGLLGIALLIVAIMTLTRGMRELRVLLFVIAVAAVIDSSYELFPTWFIPAALGGAMLMDSLQRRLDQLAPRGVANEKLAARVYSSTKWELHGSLDPNRGGREFGKTEGR